MIGVTVLNILFNTLVMIYCTAKQLKLNFKIYRARFAFWRKGSKISVFWTGVPIFTPKVEADLPFDGLVEAKLNTTAGFDNEKIDRTRKIEASHKI